MKLRDKIFVRYFIFAALPLSLLLGFTFVQIQNLVIRDARNRVEAEAEALLSQVASFEQFMFERLNVIVTRRRLQEELLALKASESVLAPADLNRVLEDIIWSSTGLQKIALFGTDMQLLAHAEEPNQIGSVLLRQLVGTDSTPQEGVKLLITNDNKLVALGAKRFISDNGDLLGYLVIQSRGDELFNFIRAGQRLGSDERVYFLVRDQEGAQRVVAFNALLKTHSISTMENAPLDATLLKSAAAGKKITRDRWKDPKGITRMVAVGALGSLSTGVVVTVPRKDILWATPLINRAFVVSAILLVIVLPLGALLLAQEISDPISKLTEIVRNFRLSKKPDGIESRTSDEIRALNDSFLEMADRLRISHEELRHRADELTEKNGLLNTEMTAHERAVAALTESEERYRSLVAATSSIVWCANPEGKFIEFQPTWKAFTGQNFDEHRAYGWMSAYHAEDKEQVRIEFENAMSEKSAMSVEGRLWNSALGRYRHTITKAVPILNKDGSIREWFGVVSDVHAKRMIAQQLAHSLKEKEVLLREMHHRVKNNLQVLTSLLKIQGKKTEGESLQEILTESRNMLRSMALVHERLYESESLSEIDFSHYLTQLVEELHSSLQPAEASIKLHLSLDEVELEIEQAIPCGLIVNELVSHCLRHGFTSGSKGNLWVQLEHNQGPEIVVRVRDDGSVDDRAHSFSKPTSLDMRIISTLTGQLGGTFEIKDAQPGIDSTLIFPKTNSVTRRTAYGNRAYYDL